MPVSSGSVSASLSVPAAGSTGSGPELTIGYRQFGTGRDVLLVPGEDGTLSWWSPQLLLALAASHRVTIFDLPGSGFSGPDPGAVAGPGVVRYADVVAGLIGALGLSNTDVVGWGMGGEIALELAARHPALVTRLVLADTSYGGASAPAGPAAAFASSASTPAVLSRYLFPAGEAGLRSAWLRSMAEESPDVMVGSAVTAEAESQASFLASGGLPPAELGRIKAKSLVIEGTGDQLFPPSDGAALTSSLPGSPPEVLVAGAGYGALFALDPAQMSALQQFLAG